MSGSNSTVGLVKFFQILKPFLDQTLISYSPIKQNEWCNFPNTEFNTPLQLETGDYSPRYWGQIGIKLGTQDVIYQNFANFT